MRGSRHKSAKSTGMELLSDFLPGLRARRLGGAPHPSTVFELYTQVEDLLEALHTSQASIEELDRDSGQLKQQLLRTVDGLSGVAGSAGAPSASGRLLTLAALSGGMFAGALDGTLLFSCDVRVRQPELRSEHPQLARPSRLLWENLDRVLETGDSQWRQAHIDDLQLLSGYGKHENRHSLEEGEALQAQSAGQDSAFPAFLLASFKGGYAMGVVDAAVMFVGGERPGAPPKG